MKTDATQYLRQEGYDLPAIEKFIAFHRASPRVWRLFERFALQAAKTGRNYGAKCIMERIRWEEEIENDTAFKVNNNYTAMYARLFAWKYPEHKDMFGFREVKGLSDRQYVTFTGKDVELPFGG
jgi:hypothetical protein